jgi:hypothetical protein
MATASAHQQQAIRNQQFLDSINKAVFPDWAVTAAFYKAVHLAEGLLVRKGRRSGSHVQRNGILKRYFPNVWMQYHPLYNQSRAARYFCVSIQPSEVAKAIQRLRAVESAVAAIP